MATLLECYIHTQTEFQTRIAAKEFPVDALVVLQELNYRICVLRTMQSFCQAAPITLDVNQMGMHYQLLDAQVRFMQSEHRFGPKADAAGIQRREAAFAALTRICEDARKRFASFRAANQDHYKASITNYVNAVLPAWIQYRNTFINI